MHKVKTTTSRNSQIDKALKCNEFRKFFVTRFPASQKDFTPKQIFQWFLATKGTHAIVPVLNDFLKAKHYSQAALDEAKKVAEIFGVNKDELVLNGEKNIVDKKPSEIKDIKKKKYVTHNLISYNIVDGSRQLPLRNKVLTEKQIEKFQSEHNVVLVSKNQGEKLPTIKPEYKNKQLYDKYKDMSFEQISKLFGNSARFSMYSQEEREMICQILSDKYIDKWVAEHNKGLPKDKQISVEHCKLEFADLGNDPKRFVFGEHYPAMGKTIINMNIFNNKFVKSEDLPSRLFETIIHETKHRIQFQTIGNDRLTGTEKAVSDGILKSKNVSSSEKEFYDYLGDIEELDARDSALAMMRAIIEGENADPAMIEYYNRALGREAGYKKNYSEEAQKLLPQFKNLSAEEIQSEMQRTLNKDGNN